METKQMPPLAYKHIHSLLDDYDVFLFDIWGVIVEGTQTYPGVVEHINYIIKHNKQVFFVSNAPVRRSALLPMLQSWQLAVSETMIITSGDVAAHMIVNSANIWGIAHPHIYHLQGDINYLMDASRIILTANIYKADLLLLTLYCDQTIDLNLNQWDPILKAASTRKIPILCANPDIGIMQQGVYRYCAGYFAEKVKQWGGAVRYAGKPYPAIYQRVLDQLPGIPKKRILMIGDTLSTDILGANQIGIDSALVLTGNATIMHNQFHSLEDKLIQLTKATQSITPHCIIQLGD